jgi:hypothetical protein
MTIPPVSMIETALGQLVSTSADQVKELKELRLLGRERIKNLREKLDLTDLERGYLLGLETARVIIATMPAAVIAGVEI